MEVMEDGNLMDKVQILIQRDMEYYKDKQTILQEVICPGIIGGLLDFPLSASFAAVKLVSWWEDEFVAGFRKGSGIIKKYSNSSFQDPQTENDEVAIIKTSDPSKFSSLVVTSAESFLDHLHSLTQEALDHADLSVLIGAIGATSLLKNCLWFYNKVKDNDNLQNTVKKFEEMNEAIAERLLDLHCRLLSLYILQDSDCLDWESKKQFFESERGSFTIQMWCFYMKGTRDDLWKTVPPEMAQRVFSGMLSETLTILTVRYCQTTPSIQRNNLILNDLANFLFCMLELLPSICKSTEELVGIALHSQNNTIRNIHEKCNELFSCFLLRGAPLEVLYRVFRKHALDAPCIRAVCGISPWILLVLSNELLNYPNYKTNFELPDQLSIFLEVTILTSQPQPDWCLLLKVLCMKDGFLLRLFLQSAVKDTTISVNCTKKKSGSCEGFLCKKDGFCTIRNSVDYKITNVDNHFELVSAITYIILHVGNVTDISKILVSSIEEINLWSDFLDKRQVWNLKKPAWMIVILEIVNPMLPVVVNTVTSALKTGASMFQAMSLIIGCFMQLWSCINPIFPHIAHLLQEAIPPNVKPLGDSVLFHLLMSALYMTIIQISEGYKPSTRFSDFEEKPSPDVLNDKTILLTVAEGICSIDEDNKHTEELKELLTLAEVELETNNDNSYANSLQKIENSYETRKMITSEILVSDFGKRSLKNMHMFLLNNQDWLIDNLKLKNDSFANKNKNLSHSMFHVWGKPFDQLLSGKWVPEWKKLLLEPLGFTSEKIWSQLSKRPEFKEKSNTSYSSHVSFMVDTLENIFK